MLLPCCSLAAHSHAAPHCRAYKIRDIFEEMTLDGVPKNVDTYFRAMFASMQARRLGDALYYWENLKRSGISPDVGVLS